MRGKIDLGDHKMAGLHRMALRHQYRTRMPKCPDASYRQLWRIVNGAVRTTFRAHPEYLTPAGHESAVQSITKRVTGSLHGYAAQSALNRSVMLGDAPIVAAVAGGTVRTTTPAPWAAPCLKALTWVRSLRARIRGGWLHTSHQKFKGARDE
jgi:hypothetical protein